MPIDRNSAEAHSYIKMMRAMEATPAGRRSIRHRPPMDRGEALISREVRQAVDARTYGPVSGPRGGDVAVADDAACGRCGGPLGQSPRPWRATYRQVGGSLVCERRYLCPDC